MQRKLFIVLLVCFMLLFAVSSASALTIVSNIQSDGTRNDDGTIEYLKFIDPGQSFSYTLTAIGASGTVSWTLEGPSRDEDDPTEVSSTAEIRSTGENTAILSGVFSDSGTGVGIGIRASDSSSSTDSIFALVDSALRGNYEYTNGYDNPAIPENQGGIINESPSASQDVILQGNIVPITSEDLEEGVLETIAEDARVKIEDINFLTQSDIGTTYGPTLSMQQQASEQNMQYIAQFRSITLSSDNYYLFQIDFPEEYVGMSVNDVRLQFADISSLQSGSVRDSQLLTLMADRILAGTELRTMAGKAATNIGVNMLILLLANTGGSFVMFALKALAALFGSGCNATTLAGPGLAGLLMAGLVITLRKRFKK